MNKLLLLIKIQMQSLIYKTTGKQAKKRFSGLLLAALPFFACLYLSFMYSFMLLESLPEGSKHITIYLMTIIALFMLLSFGYQSASGYLFGYKDFDLLKSLPFTDNQIFASKFISFTLTEYLYDLFLLLPAYLICGIVLNMDFQYYFFGLFLIGLLPIVPLVLSAILAILVILLSSNSRFSVLLKNVFSIAMIFVIFVFSFSFQLLIEMDASTLLDLANNISKYLPFAGWIIDLMFGGSLLKGVSAIMINIGVLVFFIITFSQSFLSLNSKLRKGYRVKDYILKTERRIPVLLALLKKELRTYYSNSAYLMNTISFPLLLLAGAIYLLINKDIVYFIPHEMYSMIYGLISSAILFGTLTCCSTNCSISIEGKQFYLLKSLPLSVKDIFISKIMVNLLILIPVCTIALLLVAFVFNIDLLLMFLYFVEIVACSLFISLFGLILNLHFYRFDYENPIYVIKQSVPVFITVFGSMIFALVVMFISLFLNLEAKMMIIFIDGIFVVLNIIQIIYLKKKGKILFLKVN